MEYLNNKTFQAEIERFKKAQKGQKKNRKEFDEAQVSLYYSFNKLAKNIIDAYKFHFVDQDDALQELTMICFEKLHRFDPNIGSAFNFCTTVILNHYRQLYRYAKTYHDLKIRLHNHLYNKSDDCHLISYRSRNGNYNAIREKLENLENL